ncbi:MAG: 16S rRNA (guanine(966)-N(2))-methyltransferase RsmD [Acidobacteriota bacterium]
MRIIAGEFRSRRLKTLPGLETRPTPDRLRESLFDILAPGIEGTVFVDAYAGTGAVGIEALSRGAREAVFIEKNRAAAGVIRQNLASLGAETRAQVITGKTAVALARLRADIVFLDPPYHLEKEYEAALAVLGEAPPALAIAQHTVRLKLAETYGRLRRTRQVRQGDNVLSFYAEAKS